MKVKIWGARGSIPAPLTPDEVREKIYQAILNLPAAVDPKDPVAVRHYVDGLPALLGGTAGGNTSCIEIRAGKDIFIIDAGSGIRDLGLELMKGTCGQGKGTVHLFFSHAHWDHIQGFPFFRPAFIAGNRICIYSVHEFDWRETVLVDQQRAINFPIPLDYLQANLEFVKLAEKQTLTIGSVKISNIQMHHPGKSYAYRFEDEHSAFVYASDAEYKLFDMANLRPYLDFFADADVLIFDSQLTFKEATFDKEDWGHSSALVGVDLARRAGVKKLVLFHHDPTDTDADLMEMQAEALEYQAQDSLRVPVEILVAHEGLTFDLSPASAVVIRYQDDAVILTLPRIFDERMVDEFEHQLSLVEQRGWPSCLVLDWTQVESLAIVGLKPLITLRRDRPDIQIALAGLSEKVRRVIQLAGYLDFFAIYPSVVDAIATPTVDKLTKDRYQLEEIVGESWLGVVYRAIDTLSHQTIALRVLSTSFSEHATNQFLHQARQLISLDHPNIVNVLDCDRDLNQAYIVQEFVDGHTLHEALQEQPNGRLALEQAIEIGVEIARALEYAHGRGVIHGDLTPKNVFLTTLADGVKGIKLSDFGLGRLREGYNLLDTPLILSKTHCLAPEQILGQALDARTDLYALGVILYEAITGRPPFQGSAQEVMRAHLNDTPQPPRKFAPYLSRSLEHFILKLLAKNPNERYATAHQTQRVLSNLGIRGREQTGGQLGLSYQHQRPLVGREQPLQELWRYWEQASSGRGQVVFIAGETGIGKTRLTQEIALQVQMGALLIGNCHALEGSLAYQPFIEALRTYFATVPPGIADKEVGQLLSNVVRLVPEIRTVLPDIPEAPPLEPKQEQLRLMNSLAQYIQIATRAHPWLLILDDLHWADQSSLQLLHYLARHCEPMALMIVGTYRDTDLESDHPLLEIWRSLQHYPVYQGTLTLDRLDQSQVDQMLTNIWHQPVPAELTQKIYQVTEGNPFYVEEVAKGLVDEGTVKWQEGAWHFSARQEIRLPQSVRDAVLRRIAHLSRETQTLLRQAAVLGRTFNFDDLQEMSDLSEWAILEHLDVVIERQLIEEAPGETMLRFSHAEIQQVLYEELSTLRRRMLHRQAGEALERRYLTDPRRMAEELAHHFLEAGELEKALIYSIQAARHADKAYASQTALMWYGRALEVLDQLGLEESTQHQLFDLLLARERIYGRQAMREQQAADLEAAQQVAEQLNNPAKKSQIHNRRAYYYRLINNYPEAVKQAQLGLEAARQAQDPILEGESLSNLAYAEQDRGQFEIAKQHLEAAQLILEQTADRRGEAIALSGLGDLQRHLKNYELARRYYERALAMNRSIGNRRGESACLNNLGELERETGNYPPACAYYEQTLTIDQAIGDRQGEALALHNLSQAYLSLGHYEKARSYVEQALPIFRSIEDQVGLAASLGTQSAIAYAEESYETARNLAQQAFAQLNKLDGQPYQAEVLLLLGQSLEALGDIEGAYQTYTQSLAEQLARQDEAGALESRAGLARCLLVQNDLPGALTQIETSLTWLAKHNFNGVANPFRFYHTAYQVLQQANKPEKARQILNEAHHLLQNRAATIEDASLRRSFLENVPHNRDLLHEWAKLGG